MIKCLGINFFLVGLIVLFQMTMSSGRKIAPTSKIKVNPDGHWFVDEFNRVRLFHGVNSVRKVFPWYYEYLLNDTRLDQLQAFGMNVVRLGTMWSGVEPENGVYNTTYIDILKTIIEKLADRDIYVILDMHQDVMSSLYNSYDGIPRWLVESFPDPTNPYPWPLDQIDNWEQGYLTQACSEGFEQLYNNTNDALTRWADFWAEVARNFGSMPSVLGYNYINEPWVGDYFENRELALPGVAGSRHLLPAYDVINAAIRQIDSDSIQFYEPITYGVLFDGNLTGNGFDRVPGGRTYADVSAYSYHIYCWAIEFVPPDATDEEKEEAIEQCINVLLPRMFESTMSSVERTGGASILTEFGLCKASGDDVNILCETYIEFADSFYQSWVDWDYSDGTWYDVNGNPRMEKILPYVRPYPIALSGTPLSMTFNSTTLQFHLTFFSDVDIEAPTQIYIPSLRYTDGYVIDVDPPQFDFVVEGDMVFLYYAGDLEDFPDAVDVRIGRPTGMKNEKIYGKRDEE